MSTTTYQQRSRPHGKTTSKREASNLGKRTSAATIFGADAPREREREREASEHHKEKALLKFCPWSVVRGRPLKPEARIRSLDDLSIAVAPRLLLIAAH
eukprot:scaffold1290_cov112-Skeletonema_dohrnii-CCMP3373.AAC.19